MCFYIICCTSKWASFVFASYTAVLVVVIALMLKQKEGRRKGRRKGEREGGREKEERKEGHSAHLDVSLSSSILKILAVTLTLRSVPQAWKPWVSRTFAVHLCPLSSGPC
jgi:hypothetical protein